MRFKRIWPQLLIISSVIFILCIIVFLKVVIALYQSEGAVVQKYESLFYYLILLSIVVGSMITVAGAQLLKEPHIIFAIPLSSQFIAFVLTYPYKLWSPHLPGYAEFGLNFFLTSLFCIWVGGSLLAVILYKFLKRIPVDSR